MWDLRSLARDQTCTPCIGRWGLKHWTSREVLPLFFIGSLHLLLLPPLLLSAESLPSSFTGRIYERECSQMQVKPTVRYYLTPTRVIIMQRQTIRWRNWNPLCCWWNWKMQTLSSQERTIKKEITSSLVNSFSSGLSFTFYTLSNHCNLALFTHASVRLLTVASNFW